MHFGAKSWPPVRKSHHHSSAVPGRDHSCDDTNLPLIRNGRGLVWRDDASWSYSEAIAGQREIVS